jgi:hypothetical protein
MKDFFEKYKADPSLEDKEVWGMVQQLAPGDS